MKVKQVNISGSETSVEIDLFSDLAQKISKDQKAQIKSEVGDYLLEQTLLAVSEEKSPVSGGAWKKTLSKEYAKRKMKDVGNKKADLQNTGELLDELSTVETSNGIKIGVFGERAGAADGHNNLSGKSILPERKFLPGEGQSYKQNIEREVNRIISDILAEGQDQNLKEIFADVTTKADMKEALQEIFGDLSPAELRLAAFRNKNVLDVIEEDDLLDLL